MDFAHFIHRHGEQKVDFVCGIVDGLVDQSQALQMFWRQRKTDSVTDCVVKTCEGDYRIIFSLHNCH